MRNRINLFLAILILSSIFSSITAYADNDSNINEKTLTISTFDVRPISLDRLVYFALKNMGYQISFNNTGVSNGFVLANNGETNGVLSFWPDFESEYTNLIKVPLVIDHVNIYSFVRKGSG